MKRAFLLRLKSVNRFLQIPKLRIFESVTLLTYIASTSFAAVLGNAFRWGRASYLFLLLSLFLILLAFIYSQRLRKHRVQQLESSGLLARLAPGFSNARRKLKAFFFLAGLFFLIIGLSNPQFGTQSETVSRKGVDVFIALDVSKSMLAEDVKPNRLTRSKQFVKNLLKSMGNDRVGLLVFAGNAYMQMPITIDYRAAQMFIDDVHPDLIPTQGTAIGDVVDLAISSFDSENEKHKAILIITDGEDHEEEVTQAALKRAKENNVTVFTMGVGTAAGSPIPNGKKGGYIKDDANQVVVSKLNEAMLKEIAKEGGGRYISIMNRNPKQDVLQALQGMDQKEFEERVYTDFSHQFQWFLLVAFLLFSAEWFIRYAKRENNAD